MNPTYDVAIVGAGSAGAALAARLSEDAGRSVLLLEAGQRFVGAAALPPALRHAGNLSAMMPGNRHNWPLVATLRDGVHQPLPRGRVVGGSSAVNGTLFTRGLPEDFDGWAAAGNPLWSYDAVLPYFRKLETDRDISDRFHGDCGPMPVCRAAEDELVPIDRAFIAGCQDRGFPFDPDMNAPGSIGVGLLPVNNAHGVRFNTALAYLDPVSDRPNLTVRAETEVLRILLDGDRAIGLELRDASGTSQVFAGEIVLSAGAVKSPHLLLLSGIGPADELAPLGIAVAHDLPLVGKRFTDHGSVSVPIRMPRRASPLPDPRVSAWSHTALHFTSSVSDEASDLLLMQSCIPTNYCVFHGMGLRERLRMLKATLGSFAPRKLIDHARYGWNHAITVVMLIDDSEGEMRLTSADPAVAPLLRYNYLQSPRDRARMREGVRATAAIIGTEPYRRLGARRAILSDDDLGDDARLDAWVLQNLGTSIHMASSCRMGSGPEDSVVDQTCRVHGIAGLRVVDTSIMPRVVRRCPAATAVMLGERAAAFFD